MSKVKTICIVFVVVSILYCMNVLGKPSGNEINFYIVIIKSLNSEDLAEKIYPDILEKYSKALTPDETKNIDESYPAWENEIADSGNGAKFLNIIDSNSWKGFSPNLFVIGAVFRDEVGATNMAGRLKAAFPDVYIKKTNYLHLKTIYSDNDRTIWAITGSVIGNICLNYTDGLHPFVQIDCGMEFPPDKNKMIPRVYSEEIEPIYFDKANNKFYFFKRNAMYSFSATNMETKEELYDSNDADVLMTETKKMLRAVKDPSSVEILWLADNRAKIIADAQSNSVNEKDENNTEYKVSRKVFYYKKKSGKWLMEREERQQWVATSICYH